MGSIKKSMKKPGRKIDLYETEKSNIALKSNLSKCLHV